jgi:hypothetical protein
VKTLYLDGPSWDLALDAAGSIAACTEPYRLAQDAACAIRAFIGECWYDASIGVPYWADILGRSPPVQLLKDRFVDAALTVPGVVAAKVFITSAGRSLAGQVQVTDAAGLVSAAGF